jgi:hypothetical protein
MATTLNLRKLLDLQRWTLLNQTGITPSGGCCYVPANDINNYELIFNGTTAQFLYSASADCVLQLPTPSTTFPAFSSGTCAACINVGPSGTVPFNGTTTSFQLNEAIRADLSGYQVMITGGPGAGEIRTISGNTMGANGTIYVDTSFSATITTASTYRLLTPTWYVHVNSTSTGAFQAFDFVTQTWLAKTPAPGSPSSEGQMTSTDCFFKNEFISLATGTATAGGASTLTNSAKSWATNQFANAQVRIVSGTGAGQIRTIASNTATELTVSFSWTTTPDSTSAYSIEGNQSFLYLGNSGSTTFYRYNITSNNWTTLNGRASVPATAFKNCWIYRNPATHWNIENSLLNGRYLYCPRSGLAIDVYDIATNTWSSFQHTSLSSVSSLGMDTDGSDIYVLHSVSTSVGRLYKLNPAAGCYFDPQSTFTLSGFSTGAGHRLRFHTYKDGNTRANYLYYSLIFNDTTLRTLLIT